MVESGSYRRKQRLRTAVRIMTVRAWMPENRGIPIHAQQRLRGRPGSRGTLKLQSSDCHAAIFAALPSRTTFLAVVIGIARGFIASGTTRKRSTCRSPFSRLAPFI
jgi:hypothetical protein